MTDSKTSYDYDDVEEGEEEYEAQSIAVPSSQTTASSSAAPSNSSASSSSVSSAAAAAAVRAMGMSNEDLEDLQVEIKTTDMKSDMIELAVALATKALSAARKAKLPDSSSFSETAEYIKKEFDRVYWPMWHCIVGGSFGSQVIHEARTFCFFYVGKTAVLLFKAGGSSPQSMGQQRYLC